MKRWTVLAGAALLGACATTGGGAPNPQWLVGTWLMMAPDLEFPLACASGLPIGYAADGTYDLLEERGTWRLEGDRLLETPTEVQDGHTDRIGRTYVSRVRRLGPSRMVKTFEDGRTETLRRCPPSE